MKKTIIVLIVLGACMLFYGRFFIPAPVTEAPSTFVPESGVQQ